MIRIDRSFLPSPFEVPTRRTLDTTTSTIAATTTTVTFLTTAITTYLSTTVTTAGTFPVGGIVGLTLGSLILCFLGSFLALFILRMCLIRVFLLRTGLRQQLLNQRAFSRLDSPSTTSDVATHYKLATLNRQQGEIKHHLIRNRQSAE